MRSGSHDGQSAAPSSAKRKSRAGQASNSTATPTTRVDFASNRSSPEQSPERSKLKPMTTTTNGLSVQRSVSPARKAGRRMSSKIDVAPAKMQREKMAYSGSNESERDESDNDGEGDASSSEDSATEMLDAALGLSQQARGGSAGVGGTGTRTGPRRDILVQRPVVEQPHFSSSWEDWEHALLRPKKNTSQHRTRSLTPNSHGTASNLASRRKGSPSANSLTQEGLPPTYGRRSPSPSVPSSPGSIPRSKWRIPFRNDLFGEVFLLTLALIIAAYRLEKFRTPFDAEMRKLSPIPMSPLIMLIVAIPGVALFRRKTAQSSYMFPFTDERGYRTPATVDDGFAAGATIPVLLAAGFLWDAVRQGKDDPESTFGGTRRVMDLWQSAGLHPLVNQDYPPGAAHRTVVVARISLLLSTSINSFILILHIILSRTVLKVERLPTNNTKRFFGALGVASLVSFALWTLLAINHRFAWASPYITPSEAAVSSWIYQMSMYTISRIVRRGFTLGELSLATGSGISLTLEFWRLTKARLFYVKYGGIPATFRLPTPLVPFHHVMIPGAFLTGFLLAPLLILSRNFAQMPSHRLKRPEERGKTRKLVALGAFSGLVLIVCLPFGGWAGWALGGGFWTPWLWGLRYCLFGGDGVEDNLNNPTGWRRWKRLLLALYWLAIVTSAVGGWQTRLVRARRIRLAKSKNASKAVENGNNNSLVDKAAIEMAGVANVRENRKMYVALDLRRKFFHALAVVMFVPAIAVDPAFTSLAFSVAFAIFSFAEYARYFAVYPIGAPIHVFFSEFIDSKDAGPVILSHFYLLTGCAGGLWLEGRGVMNYSGVLTVGIGDAFASVLGRRLGTTKWPHSNKTILGTSAFVISIFASAMLLRLTGVVPFFSAPRFLCATVLAGLLEAVSAQNDNLIIPIVFWSLLSLLEV